MIKVTGGPAFPVAAADGDSGSQVGASVWQFPGMTLRDYFAAKAMAMLIAEADESMREWLDDCGEGLTSIQALALTAYQIADAMLAERAA